MLEPLSVPFCTLRGPRVDGSYGEFFWNILLIRHLSGKPGRNAFHAITLYV